MNDKHSADPGAESSWSLRGAADSLSYFFDNDRESSILSAFGWNLNPEKPSNRRTVGEVPDSLTGNRVFSAPESSCSGGMQGSSSGALSNPSVSSSSNEDPADKSTGFGGKPPEIPSIRERKKGQKRIRQPRFAFMTKSQVDNLEDGYRRRKYGQKAVKNSPFPRSYYRCTNSKCTVKKRVERSCEDTEVVITTYEGQHCHHTVGFQRESHFPFSQFYYSTANIHSPAQNHPPVTHHHAPAQNPPPPTDEGLLGDMVPPGMRSR